MQNEEFTKKVIELAEQVAHIHLINRVKSIQPAICDPESVAADLFGETLTRCLTKVNYEILVSESDVRAVIYVQSRDVFAKFWKGYKKRVKEIIRLNDYCNHVKAEGEEFSFETKDLLKFLMSKLTVQEFELYYFRVFENRDYSTLADYFGKKVSALRKQFERVSNLVRKIMKNEKL